MLKVFQKYSFSCILFLVFFGTANAVMAQQTMTGGDGVGKIPYFTCPSIGQMRFPVIIVKYKDVGLSDTEENVMKHFDEFFNKEGYSHNGATGSVRDYFLYASAGRFAPQFDVLGVVQLEQKRSYYGKGAGTSAGHPDEMVIEGVNGLRDKVDFSVYDSDGDGYVDDVVVVYAGNAERFGASTVAVLPTSYLISYNKYDQDGYTYGYEMGGMFFDSYTVVSELAYSKYDGVGTFLHEYSHGLGLADLYNVYDAYADYTPMEYDLLDIGLYNNNSNTPPTYSSFERYALGWIDAEVIDGPRDLRLEPLGDSNKAYVIPVSENEFFFIENRQKKDWDTYLPGDGLFVWHLDYDQTAWFNNMANYEKDHQRIRLLRPSGTQLALESWDGEMQLAIDNIKVENGVLTASISGGSGVENLQMAEAKFSVCGRTVVSDSDIVVIDAFGRIIGKGRETTLPSVGVYFVKYANKISKILIH